MKPTLAAFIAGIATLPADILPFAEFGTADYQGDFIHDQPDFTDNAGRPGGEWRMLWNQFGPVGFPVNYVDLLWDSANGRFDGNGPGEVGANNWPGPDPIRFGRFSESSCHPGLAAGQTGSGGLDRYAVAAHTIARDGDYAITNSNATRTAANGDGVDILVHVNGDAALFTGTVAPEGSLSFDTALGTLATGDVVYVGIGPATSAGSDTISDFNYEIERTGPAGTPADLSAGGVESSAHMILIEEQTITASNLAVDAVNPAGSTLSEDGGDLGTAGTLDGVEVTSWLLHYDRTDDLNGPKSGQWTFDGPVLGVIFEDASLDATDDLLGLPGTLYPSDAGASATSFRGSINEQSDFITTSADGRTIDVSFAVAAAAANIDTLRVLVGPPVASQPPVLITDLTPNGNALDVSFTTDDPAMNHSLERSLDLGQADPWTEVASGIPGTSPAVLQDPIQPAVEAYYRIVRGL